MAFPTIQNSTTQAFPNKANTHDVDIPAGWSISSGELLIIFYDSFSHPSYSVVTPTDWTAGYADNGSTLEGTLFAGFYKSADGTEAGTSVTIDHGGGINEGGLATVYHITGWNDIEFATVNFAGTTSTPNVQSLSPTWDAKDTLWIEHAMIRSVNTTLASASTGYSGILDVNASGGTSLAHSHASAHRENNTATEDPDSMTFNATDEVLTMLVAIEPVAAVTNVSVSDSVGVSDSVNQLSNDFTQSDSVSLADTIAEVLNSFTVSDSVSVADTNDFDISFIIADSVGVSDSVSIQQSSTSITVTDSIGISDSVSVDVELTLSDALNLADSLNSLGVAFTESDVVFMSDSLSSLSVEMTLQEAISIVDSQSTVTEGGVTLSSGRTYKILFDKRSIKITAQNRTINIGSQ